MRRLTLLILLFILPWAVTALPRVFTSASAVQGEVVTALIWHNDDLDDLSGRVIKDGKEIAWAEGFFMEDFTGENGRVGVVLLPLSTSLNPGEASLELQYRVAGRLVKDTRPIRLDAGEFRTDEIPLNQSMSALRQEPDPEKTRQAREMWALLISRRDDALHWSDAFLMPVESLRRTSFFGDRRRYLYSDGAVDGSIHTGIDFSAAPGTAVHAAGSGRVVYSGNRIITGETVVIEHLPGVYTLYYHMRDRFAQEGSLTQAGTLIGTVGSTGLSTGAHLHWEVRVNGVPVSPDFLLSHPLIDKSGLIGIMEGTN